MKRIFYASGSLVTGDRMADAIVHYAEALAMRDTSDTIDVPIALRSGAIGRAQLLIGPASQLVVVPEEGAIDREEDEATIQELMHRSALLASPRPQASDVGDAGTDYVDANGYDAGVTFGAAGGSYDD